MAKTSSLVKNRWNQSRYDIVSFQVRKGERVILQEKAKEAGVSTQKFILNSINAAHPGLLSPLDNERCKKKAKQPEPQEEQ